MMSPAIRPIASSLDHIDDAVVFHRDAAVVIVTRGHQYDEAILRQIAAHETGYVGMIGSKRRVLSIFQQLRKDGVPQSFLDTVKAPIGLNIGAKTPQEIAVAIHAEIIQHFNPAKGKAEQKKEHSNA
jgi:xanthine dehydrogenase accessory factor